MATPFPPTAIRTHAAILRKLQEQEREIKAQTRKIQELTFNLKIQEAYMQNIRHEATIPRNPSLPPPNSAMVETPVPHRLQVKPERPEDLTYKAKIAEP